MKKNDNHGGTATMNAPKRTTTEKFGGDKDEIMRKVEAAGKPGIGHKALEHFVGSWKAEVKCWSDPGGEPHVSEASARGSWILNGRYLQEDFQGEMMGKPFQGRNIFGYDNVKQTFNSVWISDMQTSMFCSEGRGENNNQIITLEGTSSCAATGRTDVPMKVVLRVLSPDKHLFEMFDTTREGNTKSMEITYTRLRT